MAQDTKPVDLRAARLARVLERARAELAEAAAVRMHVARRKGLPVEADGLLCALVIAQSVVGILHARVSEADLEANLEAEVAGAVGDLGWPMERSRSWREEPDVWRSVVEQVQSFALGRMLAERLETGGVTAIMHSPLGAEQPVAALATTLPSRAATRAALTRVVLESLVADGVELEDAADAAMRDFEAAIALKGRNG